MAWIEAILIVRVVERRRALKIKAQPEATIQQASPSHNEAFLSPGRSHDTLLEIWTVTNPGSLIGQSCGLAIESSFGVLMAVVVDDTLQPYGPGGGAAATVAVAAADRDGGPGMQWVPSLPSLRHNRLAQHSPGLPLHSARILARIPLQSPMEYHLPALTATHAPWLRPAWTVPTTVRAVRASMSDLILRDSVRNVCSRKPAV